MRVPMDRKAPGAELTSGLKHDLYSHFSFIPPPLESIFAHQYFLQKMKSLGQSAKMGKEKPGELAVSFLLFPDAFQNQTRPTKLLTETLREGSISRVPFFAPCSAFTCLSPLPSVNATVLLISND